MRFRIHSWRYDQAVLVPVGDQTGSVREGVMVCARSDVRGSRCCVLAALVGVGGNLVEYRPLRCFEVIAWKHVEIVIGMIGEG
jgi:hypothetical protein